ncbi:hypothetical protein CSAL01_04494 [Colletotrichum salicis]|uniref:Hemolysin-III related n=1 Tax=Colletotrichum salicis TaxID=1209931 RepID=A0A135UAX8_9PEZI|nr:hypothetical protein CSAL01_04494 [Colletotrichum salicis]
MAALLSTSALRRRLRTAIDSDPPGRRLWSWSGPSQEAEVKVERAAALLSWEELSEWQQCGSDHIKTGYRRACNSVPGCLASWTYMHNESVNIYSHVTGAIIFILLPFFVFSDGIPARWSIASTADVVVCMAYAIGATICFVLSTAFHTLMSHSEPIYLSGIKADFHGVLTLMWSSVFPLAHNVFPCSPATRDAYIALTGLLAALCAAATARPDLGAVDLGHHRAALFAMFGLAAFVVPIGHGVVVADGGRELWDQVGGCWVLWTAGWNCVAVFVYWAKRSVVVEVGALGSRDLANCSRGPVSGEMVPEDV